ncbi:Gfo/Idh/MocA family protein [Alloyangia pacifica]|uniref:Predicted dehydrogenase n=1 Tax=Alloyangia pacifica TaxID=311180 RepID=A0A1I6W3E1_9RHOB|nr:Gfo/Idh/MocA family oxidoreductase [Alloyangia pacifica]SDI41174.1 Predicted dehydrogenase [Alloyangia pacifica]SFT20499.1 Predicted dehydrogenase [Alloyangia pacifica]
MKTHTPIRLGMVGGGKGAMIGEVHRIAARLDNRFALVAGALSTTPERNAESAAACGIASERTYDDFAEMARAEAARPDGIEAVSICTPNHLHFPVAKAFLEAGIHVICDKPMTSTLEDARALERIVAEADALFVLTHNYSGYPQLRLAREMVARGDLGALRLVQVEYAQDWLSEDSGSKQAAWRVDPEKAGAGGSIGDIGTHAWQLARFVSGMVPDRLAADLTSFVPGRRVDDNAQVMLRYASGAKGALWCSQVAPGSENGLKLRVYGEKAGLEWAHETPETLWVTRLGEPRQMLRRGAQTMAGSRVPAGHPEGFLEGFANIYAEAAEAIRAHQAGAPLQTLLPGIRDGVEGLEFVDACIRSARADSAWVEIGRD